MKPETSLLGQSALQAFRADLPPGGATPDAEDEAAILVATLLRQHLMVPAGDQLRAAIMEKAIEVATTSLGSYALEEGCRYDDHPSRSAVDVMRRLVQRTDGRGWVRLGQHLLESSAAIATDPLDQGRLLADRSRNSARQGLVDLALEQADELKRRGTRLRSNELLALAHDRLAGEAQIRGNWGEMRRNSEAVVRLARRAGLRKVLTSGHLGLGVNAGLRGDFSAAVGQFWTAFHVVAGRGDLAAEALGNLAHALLLAGRPGEARKIATLLFRFDRTVHGALPVIGTYSLACARLGDRAAVEWASAEVQRLAKRRSFPRQVAEAMIECAAALEIIGRVPQGGVLRRRAENMAVSFGFHDLTFREVLVTNHGTPPERPRFTGIGARAEREIAQLDVTSGPMLQNA